MPVAPVPLPCAVTVVSAMVAVKVVPAVTVWLMLTLYCPTPPAVPESCADITVFAVTPVPAIDCPGIIGPVVTALTTSVLTVISPVNTALVVLTV